MEFRNQLGGGGLAFISWILLFVQTLGFDSFVSHILLQDRRTGPPNICREAWSRSSEIEDRCSNTKTMPPGPTYIQWSLPGDTRIWQKLSGEAYR
ncbi:uncharacterized protein F5147DRAFT_694845 [Suillus discolor]|uniref:Uncharacterized protein n=1 Tax=Suillus discolor TaxID=1912936 RepID=A0A9P7JUF2_9AGAM|nr:uncharacterized protein F5147DRAFT_694845 [Suillus discolor]KAG2108413.1 hypothetical protein F5147DRAFT_694845 [Suillus discolor]